MAALINTINWIKCISWLKSHPLWCNPFLQLGITMSIKFSGWEALCDKSKHLKPGQAPKANHGYTMYHGTHKTTATTIISSGFRPSAGGTLGAGVYCSRDINKAMGYPGFCSANDRVVLKLCVRVGKVKKIDIQSQHLRTTWHQQGYDTAWLPAHAGLEEDCVWDPKRLTVVGIAHCTDSATKGSLEKLIKQEQKKLEGGQDMQKVTKCKFCGNQPQLNHTVEKCWECKDAICPFMDKHVCHKRSWYKKLFPLPINKPLILLPFFLWCAHSLFHSVNMK